MTFMLYNARIEMSKSWNFCNMWVLCFSKDLVVHVRDVSHPECEAQLQDVMTVLEKQLCVKASLMENMIEVHNKSDLW